jgi:uncharacterized membrane-anchored protein YjiN (DUF445 family)
VRAFAEAAMVGALADWFAVTALFRHPLGIPIPHTAIVPTKKDEIGRGLGGFVQDNFLTPSVLGEKVRAAEPAVRLGAWLSEEQHARRVGDLLGRLVTAASEVLRDEDVQAILEQNLRARARGIEAAPVVGRVLREAAADGRQALVVNSALTRLEALLNENRNALRQAFAGESPWWVPMRIDDRVFERIFSGFLGVVGAVRADPAHPLRVSIEAQITAAIERLQTDPVMIARGEQLKDELLNHPSVKPWIADAWTQVKAGIVDQSTDPTSELRRRVEHAVTEAGRRLVSDAALAAKADGWAERAVGSVVAAYGHELAGVITSTVERWDTTETVDRIETQIGRDLQFIRINGTVVGGLAGLVIHTVSHFL